MNPSTNRVPGPATGRVAFVVLVIAVTLSFTGFFMGTANRDRARVVRETPAEPVVDEELPTAPTYRQGPRAAIGPNRSWHNDLSGLRAPAISPDPARLAGEDARAQARTARAARRAFDGAPPVVPHPIDQNSSAACLSCHGQGVVIGERVAPKISHPAYAGCTQCHVESQAVNPGVRAAASVSMIESSFLRRESFAGDRAYPGAPPTIPHASLMRNDCLSCHGPGGHAGLKTSHPARQSCTQCHALSAQSDAQPFVSRDTTPWAVTTAAEPRP